MVRTHFEILAHPYRQRVLVALLQEDRPIRVPEDLRYRDGNADDLGLRLQHVDLPKLADAGLIEWDPEERTVSRGPAYEEIRPLVETLVDDGFLPVVDASPSD